jgi:light-regulated signal transduction histidine kinase (bacteriophytochrome)
MTEIIHPKDRDRYLQNLHKLRETNQPVEIEFRIQHKDKSIRWFSQACQTVFPEGEFLGLRGSNRDITDKKMIQKELQIYREKLEELVKQRTAELERSNHELQQFAYVASHDLQEPLRMVASFVQLIADKYSDKLDEKGLNYIHFAVDGAMRLQNLIQGLLSYSRVESTAQISEATDCNEVLQDVKQNLFPLITETQAEIIIDHLPVVMADRIQMMQLFQNLLGNAIKFRGADKPRIHISVTESSENYIFSVKDNGIGIEPQYAERIFVIFQRLHHRDAYPGTGIGLAICKKIVERHGGRLFVQSEPGKGSTFMFTLPKEAS